jgi:hypothetical protein
MAGRVGYRRFETLLDIARKGYWVRLACPCGHETKFNALVLAEKLVARDSSTRLNRLGESLKCGKCGGKAFRAEHCRGPEIWSG